MSIQNDDRKAFLKLYHEYAPAIFGILIRTITDKELAKECLNRSFYKMWSGRLNYDPGKERLFTWMVKIAMSCTNSEPFVQKNQSDNNLREAIDLILGTNIKTYLELKYQAEEGNFGSSLDSTMMQAINLIYFKSQGFSITAEKLGLSLDELKRIIIQSIKKLKMATNSSN
ncbi:MAG: hypothetical protein EOO85_30790 [Pedobacter sp.]|nr:MAG: hypothetical protein EOO85_30790 [Pedobacter sp.]